MLAALSTSDWIQLAIAIITGIAALAAAWTARTATHGERKRTQPIVIAHEERERSFSSAGAGTAWVVDAYLTSEGAGPAYNVRFGVEFAGVRYPYRLTTDDPVSGNLQRVLRPGERRPPAGSWSILLDSEAMWGRAADAVADARGTLDASRIYWARYENAEKQTWETRNPGDRSSKLDIRRIRRVERVERREQKGRERAGQRDVDVLRGVLEALEAARTGQEPPQA